MNNSKIYVTINNKEHQLSSNDFNELLKILKKNQKYDAHFDIFDNYISIMWPDSDAVCSYMCVFMD